MAIPLYDQQIAPPHKPSRRGLAGLEARAKGEFAEQAGQTAASLFGFAGKLFEVASRTQANEAMVKARQQWREFRTQLQQDPEYATYGEKFDNFYKGLHEKLGTGIKLPRAKRELDIKLDAMHASWIEDVSRLADARAIHSARSVRVDSINQAIEERDADALARELSEAGGAMEFEASDLAKLRDAAYEELVKDQTMEHARAMGAAGVEWLTGDEAEGMFAVELGPDQRFSVDADTRQKMADELSREQAQAGKLADEQLDRTFADLHIQADSREKIDEALGQLAATDFYNGDQKYIWEQRFQAKRAQLLNMADLPSGALDDWYKNNEDALWARLAIAKADGMPLGALRQIVEDSYYGRDKEGTGKPRVRGSFVKAAFEYLEAKEDPAFSAGIKAIESKTAGLDDMERARATNDFRAWMQANPNADAKTIEAAAENIARPVVQRNLDRWGRRSWEVLWGNKRVLDEFEQLTRDIQEGLYTGLAASREEYLARYNAYLVGKAQKEFPEQDIASVFTDQTGAYGGKPGTAIMVSATGKPYAYKLEGKQLTLYRLARTRDGKYTWQQVGKAGQATAAEQIAEQERKAAAKAASLEEQKRRAEFARQRFGGEQ